MSLNASRRHELGMNSVYFLVPGLRVPSHAWDEATRGADFSTLATLFEGADPVLEQTLVQTPVLAGATHLLWLWEVLSKTRSMPETAAFEWEADGGPAMGTETWRLWSAHLQMTPSGLLTESPRKELSAAERDQLHDDILAVARRHGFQLQQWADRWYLTRNQDWNLVVRPWCAQKYRPFSTDSLSGADEQAFIALDEKLRAILKKNDVNAKRLAQGMETIDGFWPDGGSRRHLLKPSTIRAVMANDSYVWGWAQNAGLLNFRTTALKDNWPEAPEGDLLAVVDGLYESYRQKDWSTWAQKLPDVIKTVTHLADLAHARRATRLVLVASGARDTHTVVIDKNATKSLFARFKKKKTLNLENFLGETGL